MKTPLDEQIDQVRQAIAELEAKRPTLGEAVVESALVPLMLRLDELLRLRQPSGSPPLEIPAEQRKLVSVLCADLAGFTNLSNLLDPEELREVQQAYFSAVTPPIRERGGVVEKYIGDAVLAVFGLPLAREDDPERSVRAALEMQAALAELNRTRLGESGFPLQMRVGISTGTVLATIEPGEAEFVVTGEAVNLASRLQGLAPPGGVLIAHATYRHLRGAFDVEVLEPVQVKGLAEPVAIYRILRAKPRAFRQVIRGVEGIETRMVGRQAELKYLQDALLGAIEEGEGGVVTVTGEAGVGKSRLLDEFQNWIELLPQRVRFFQGKARQEAQSLPYGLLRDLVAFRFEILDDDGAEEARSKVEAGFGEVFGVGEEGQMRAHFLGQLLGYDFSLSPHLKAALLDAEQLRNRGLMYLVEYFKQLCDLGPVVVFLEDLHWADDSSLDAVKRLGELAPQHGLLLVCAARPALYERRPYWGEGQPGQIRLELSALSRRESRELVGEILKLVAEIPPELRELVVDGGEGNPFYIEELIKMLVEGGVIVKEQSRWRVEPARIAQMEVPATLAGVLLARLDSLPVKERVVLQEASVVGRLFWDRVVAHIHVAQAGDGGEGIVPEALSALRGRELVYRREESAFVDSREYLFKHDLLREVTYESVLKRLRKRYHALVADWLIAHSGERVGEYRGLIAEHLLHGGRVGQALEYLQAAGRAALAAYANPEAEVYFRRALDLSRLNPGRELTQGGPQRADLLGGLGEALGLQSRVEEAVQVLRQGIEIYRQLGDTNGVAQLYTLLTRYLWWIDYQDAWRVAQEGLEVLEGAPDTPGFARLLTRAGRAAFFRAEPPERIIGLCQRAIAMAERLGEVEVQADAINTLALQTWDDAEALNMFDQAVSLTESRGPSYAAATARCNLSVRYYDYYIDLGAALQYALKSVEMARQIGDIEGVFFNLYNVAVSYFKLGNLDSVMGYLKGLLGHTSAPQDRIEAFLHERSEMLHYYRGEWQPALGYWQAELTRLRAGSNLQLIAYTNLELVDTLLELNYFAGLEDLSDAEAALEQNIAIRWFHLESRFLWVIIEARRRRLAEARLRMAEAQGALNWPENNRIKVFRLTAEAELARAEGSWDQAISASRSLVEIFEKGEFRWNWARELIRLGDALRQQSGSGDPQRAREAYQQALAMFTEMVAPGYIAALQTRLQALESQP